MDNANNLLVKKKSNLFLLIISLIFLVIFFSCACYESELVTPRFKFIDNVANIDSNDRLSDTSSLSIAQTDGTTYLIVGGEKLSVFSVDRNGSLTNVYNTLTNTFSPDSLFKGIHSSTTAVVEGQTYLLVGVQGTNNRGELHSFLVNNNGQMDHITNVIADNLIDVRSLSTAEVAGTTYLFAAGAENNIVMVGGFEEIGGGGVNVFSVDGNGGLDKVYDISDEGDLKLSFPRSLATAEVGGTTYLFASGHHDNGVSVFSVNGSGTLSNVTNVGDDDNLNLGGVQSLTTARVRGSNYLFVAGEDDDGISVFSVNREGMLSNVTNINDDDKLNLKVVRSITTTEINGRTYLFAAGQADNGVSIFLVGENGSLDNVYNINDEGDLELNYSSFITTAKIEGATYLFVLSASYAEIIGGSNYKGDNGISVFRLRGFY